MTFKVRLTRDAEADLDRLFDFLVERELARDGGDLYLPEQAMVALRAGIATLKSSPIRKGWPASCWSTHLSRDISLSMTITL